MKNEQRKLIDIGTCGLHVLHGWFKHAEERSELKLKKLLSSFYITDASANDYPLPFCAHRWVENERVAKKGRSVWDKIPVIVDYWKTLPRLNN